MYNYFETYFLIVEAGPPAYVVFNNVNYSYTPNFDAISNIQAELASINNTVISPIYSWVSEFENFINPSGTWAESCNSSEAAALDFDDQMKLFVKISVNSQCCQSYGICGESFAAQINFDDDGVVIATNFRF